MTEVEERLNEQLGTTLGCFPTHIFAVDEDNPIHGASLPLFFLSFPQGSSLLFVFLLPLIYLSFPFLSFRFLFSLSFLLLFIFLAAIEYMESVERGSHFRYHSLFILPIHDNIIMDDPSIDLPNFHAVVTRPYNIIGVCTPVKEDDENGGQASS